MENVIATYEAALAALDTAAEAAVREGNRTTYHAAIAAAAATAAAFDATARALEAYKAARATG
jgi:hypothetical protein